MEEFKRYAAQTRLPEIGEDGQRRLARSSVLTVGCGALGSPVAIYLAAAGVGRITIADFDTVDLSNLHRQVFYKESETGLPKAEILKERIGELNREVEVTALKKMVTPDLLETLREEFDLIIDAADNPATTYMLDSHCKARGIPFVTAGVTEWRAQTFTSVPGSASYGDIFPEPEEGSGLLPCSIAGITGPTAAFAASLQAAEALKILIGKGGKQSRLTTANLLTGEFNSATC